ncbi:MAG: hypothetical protein WAO61_02910 [Solirubrobacterales bacterium]
MSTARSPGAGERSRPDQKDVRRHAAGPDRAEAAVAARRPETGPAQSAEECLMFSDPAWDDAFGSWTGTLRICCL